MLEEEGLEFFLQCADRANSASRPSKGIESIESGTLEDFIDLLGVPANGPGPSIETLEDRIRGLKLLAPQASEARLHDVAVRAVDGWVERLSVLAPREKTVVSLMLQKGGVTNKELTGEALADYALRSLRTRGIWLSTKNITCPSGRSVFLYELVPEKLGPDRERKVLAKGISQQVAAAAEYRCVFCDQSYRGPCTRPQNST